MTFSFDDTLATPLDRIRARIGDTHDEKGLRHIVSDERVMSVYAAHAESEDATVYALLQQIVMLYARKVSSTVGPYREEAQQMYEHYKELRDEAAGTIASGSGYGMPYFIDAAMMPKARRE